MCSPPRERVEFHLLGTLCRILETERRPAGLLCIYRFFQQRAFSGAEGGSDTAVPELVQSKFSFLCSIDLVRIHCCETDLNLIVAISSVVLVIELEYTPGGYAVLLHTIAGTFTVSDRPNATVQSAVPLCIPEVLGSDLGLQTHFL